MSNEQSYFEENLEALRSWRTVYVANLRQLEADLKHANAEVVRLRELVARVRADSSAV